MAKKLLMFIFVLLFLSLSIGAQAAGLVPQRQVGEDVDALLERIATLTANPPTLHEPFRQDEGRWDVASDDEVTRQYQTSTLHIGVASEQTVAWSTGDISVEDFYLEVDAFHIAGSLDNQFGVLFRLVDDANFYFFAISSDGYYSVQKKSDDEWSYLLDWASAEPVTVGEGEGNRIGILAEGAQISVLVNGELLATVEDDEFTKGQLALAVGAFDNGNVTIAFDDLLLWEPGAVAALTETATAETETTEAAPTPTPDETSELISLDEQLEEIRSGEPLLDEDFRRDNGEWASGENGDVTYAYDQRTYRIVVAASNLLGYSINTTIEERQIPNFLAEVDIRQIAGSTTAEYGFIFHYQDIDNYYIAVISGEGEYSLWKKDGGEWSTLVEWTASEAINRDEGGENRLGLLVDGAQITLLVNNEVLTQLEEESSFFGSVGLLAGTLDEPNLEVAFDNFILWGFGEAPVDEPIFTDDLAPLDVTARLAEIRENDPSFSDDFRRDNGDWGIAADENMVYAYERRTLQFDVLSDNWIGWSFSTELDATNPADFLAEVDVEHLSGPLDGEMGLIFRFVDNRNFYLFAVRSQGDYALLREVAGEWQTVVDWTESDALVTGEGALNRIGVLAEGKQITLLINDVAVVQVEDDAFSAGKLGLAAGTFDEGGLQVAFDNLDVWVLTAAAASTMVAANAPDAAVVAERLEEIKNADPVFSDEFRRASDVWEDPGYDSVTFSYVGGAYHITVDPPNITPGSTGDVTVGNFLLEVDGAQLSGPTGQYGVFFRQVDDQNFYLFAVTPFQTYSLWKMVDGEWSALIEWTKADAILAAEGEVNRLGVLAEGAQITLLVNDVAVAQVEDNAFSEGAVALAAGTFDEGGIEVEFDNLDIWEVE